MIFTVQLNISLAVTIASTPEATFGNLKTSPSRTVLINPSPISSIGLLLKSKTVCPPQFGCPLSVFPCCSIISNIPSLSSSKSQPSATKSPSLFKVSLNPGHESLILITPSPSSSHSSDVTLGLVALKLKSVCWPDSPATKGIPLESTVSPKVSSTSKSTKVKPPSPSSASGQPSSSLSVSKILGVPSPSESWHNSTIKLSSLKSSETPAPAENALILIVAVPEGDTKNTVWLLKVLIPPLSDWIWAAVLLYIIVPSIEISNVASIGLDASAASWKVNAVNTFG